MMEFSRLKFTKKGLLILYLVSILLFFSSIFTTVIPQYSLESRCPFNGKGHFYLQNLGHKNAIETYEGVASRLVSIRKLLGGPGSSPPRCLSKCGRCTPCRPVHVPVPPGTPVTAEYYPEAWRCKCGNKLYMP